MYYDLLYSQIRMPCLALWFDQKLPEDTRRLFTHPSRSQAWSKPSLDRSDSHCPTDTAAKAESRQFVSFNTFARGWTSSNFAIKLIWQNLLRLSLVLL